jgi:hypothetical protein
MTQSDRYKYPLKQIFRVIIASIHVIVSSVTHKNTKHVSFILTPFHRYHNRPIHPQEQGNIQCQA